MHSIERYGIVALLFLVVTVVAVLMWDGNSAKDPHKTASGALASQARVEAPADRSTPLAEPGTDPDGARRLSLLADSQPGPLQRNRRRGGRAPASEPQQERSSEPSALQNEFEHDAGEPEPVGGTVPREQPAPEQVIGRAEPETAPISPALVAATHAYTVRKGDTLSEIAQRELGSSRHWQALVAANPGLDPAKLRVGKTIQIPGAKSASKTAASEPKTAAASAKPPKSAAPQDARITAAATGAKTWKVGKGENLWRIAERALGDGKRWGEIAKLNPKVNPDKLLLGQVLTLPGSASAKPASSTAAKSTKSGPKVVSTPSKAKPKDAPVLVASAGERGARRGGKVK